jgi:hypothetical protein
MAKLWFSGSLATTAVHSPVLKLQSICPTGDIVNVDLNLPTASSPALQAAFEQAICRGWMSADQYRCVVEELLAQPGCSLLVFGVGYDSWLWSQCVTGRLAFVEDDPKFLTLAPAWAQVVLYEYPSRVGQWCPLPEVPALIDRRWDYVLVDGPAGFSDRKPGRQFPIEWSRRLATRGLFVHDCQRPWERAVCDKVWGAPANIISATGRVSGDLAVFRLALVGKVTPAS